MTPAVRLPELRRAGSNLRGDRQVAMLLSPLPRPLVETAIPTMADGASKMRQSNRKTAVLFAPGLVGPDRGSDSEL